MTTISPRMDRRRSSVSPYMDRRRSSVASFARDYDYAVKIILLGDLGVGKSTVLQTYIDGGTEHLPQIGSRPKLAASCTRVVDYKGKKVNLTLWDTAGEWIISLSSHAQSFCDSISDYLSLSLSLSLLGSVCLSGLLLKPISR